MSVISISARQDATASFLAVEGSNRTAAVAIRSNLLAEGARFGAPLAALYTALERLAAESLPLFSQLQPGALADALRRLAARIMAGPYRSTRDAAINGKRDDATRLGRINETPSTLPFAADDRADFRVLDSGDQVTWINRADRSQLAALIVAGKVRFPNVVDRVWDMVVERYAVISHIDKSGLQADFALKPTPDQPAVVGPDVAAAEAFARNVMNRFRDDQRAIAAVEQILRDTIVAVAVATDLSVGDAFTLLNGTAA